jgi:hypothetical protein
MKVALFKDSTYEWAVPLVWSAEEDACSLSGGYVRISEIVDVEFPPLSTDAVVEQQLSELDRREREARELFHDQLERIKSRRAELQSLTYIPA